MNLNFNILTKSTFEKKVVVIKKNDRNIQKIEIIDKSLESTSKDCRYKDLSYYQIALKTTNLFFYNPIHVFLKMSYNLSMIGFDFVDQNVKFVVYSLKDLYTAVSDPYKIDSKIVFLALQNIIKNYVVTRFLMTKYWIEDAINIIKAPIYGVAIQVTLLFTLIYPNDGRKLISVLFKSWNNNISRKRDFRIVDDKDKYSIIFFYRVISNRENPYTFYPFSQLQVIGSLKDKDIVHFKTLL
ncbi:MAG: hypothetical protein K1060chlam5_00415 [Candidatus Anoxychlamydiales bacterium]|nr:hypothetical protein [Candidatus Anoxychlamydiales bacterium]